MRKQLEKYIKKCFGCQSSFYQKRSEQKFCSISCGVKITGEITRPKGEKHRLWKGCKRIVKIDPIKIRARRDVAKALARGDLIKMDCHICGNTKSEAHHADYSKPLDVEWLCRIHHRQADYRDGTKLGDFGH